MMATAMAVAMTSHSDASCMSCGEPADSELVVALIPWTTINVPVCDECRGPMLEGYVVAEMESGG